jgi:multiple sugar transport system substrate-binding protein
MPAQHSRFTRFSRAVGITAAALSIAVLAACSGQGGGDTKGGYGFPAVKQVKNSALTVWVDADREPVAKAFKAAHPDLKVNIQTYDGSAGGSDSFKTKMALFDQSGSGWPDVVFSTQVNDASWAGKESNGVQAYAAALNKGVISQKWLDGFTSHALDPVTIKGDVYAVRDNLAPVVFWYDKTLFDKFGYDIPTTWQDYETLSDKLAKEHPGYILGSVGDAFTGTYVYYWGAQAPIFQVAGDTFSSDFSNAHSKRMTALLDHMVANGTLVKDSLFSANFASKYKGKVLGIPGPTWYSAGIFQNPDILNSPKGTIGAALPLYWDGEAKVTGNVGGGMWYGSSHSKNLKGVGTFLKWVVSSDKAVDLITGLPAYADTASKWLSKQTGSGYWANPDFKKNVTTASTSIWKGWGTASFSVETGYAKVVVPALAAGKTIADVVPAWQTEIKNEAQVQGYTVK